MGTSYTTITFRGSGPEAVRDALEEQKIQASIAESTGEYTVLNLEQTSPTLDRFYQQQDEFREVAVGLSKRLEAPALAAMNLDDELLLLWAFDKGELVFQYDSNPMVLGCPVCSYSSETVPAEISDVGRLTELFGVPQNTRALRSWLRRGRGLGFLDETSRHRQIVRLLGLPEAGVGSEAFAKA